MTKGLFITFEGGEGTGKSTQIKLFNEYLEKSGIKNILTREPGGTPLAEQIRELLVKGKADKMDQMTELLLFFAARRDHVVKKIRPNIDAGITVVSDRFADSSTAYQGYGRGKNETNIKNVNELYRIVVGDFKPDLTFILDIDPKIGLMRSVKRAGNDEQRFEGMDFTFHENLRAGYLDIARAYPERCVIIDANQTVDQVHRDIVNAYHRKIQST